jgi:hypothetical protein
MRKILLVTLVIFTLALLPTLSTLVVYSTKPTHASGTFDYTFTITSERWNRRHYFFEATEDEVWEGSFEGTAVSYFRVTWFNAPSGPLKVWLRGTFTGIVHYGEMDKEGTMVIQLVGWKQPEEDWYGRWVILSGTEELANLHGRGTWWGPGFGDPGPDISYEGHIHFD